MRAKRARVSSMYIYIYKISRKLASLRLVRNLAVLSNPMSWASLDWTILHVSLLFLGSWAVVGLSWVCLGLV